MLQRLTAVAVAVASLSVVVTPIGLEAQQDNRFFFVGDARVLLQPSMSYRAFQLNGQRRNFTTLAANLPDEITEHEPFLIERHNIFLFGLPSPVSSSSLRESLEATRDNLDGVFGAISDVPVFSAGGADQVLINEFVVQFRENIERDQSEFVLTEAGAEIVEDPERIPGRYVVTFSSLDGLGALAASNELHQRDIIEFSEPNFVQILPGRPAPPVQQQSSTLTSCPPSDNPNDTLYSCQWALSNDGDVGTADADIDADGAWQLLADAPPERNITIAVLDDGVDTNQEDLSSRIVSPYDAWEGDNDQDPNALDAHGTACAGIAAAVSNNALGISGVHGEASIMPVRIAIGGPSGTWVTDNATIEDGLRTAVDRGAHVLSNSWGGGAPSNQITSGVDYALARGSVVVFATGNYRAASLGSASSVSYPASLSISRSVIAVGATNQWDELKTPTSLDGEWWWGSNFGDAVSVVAPGVHIYTTDISGGDGYDNTDYFSKFNGTSSAAPHVAGIAALMLSVNSNLTPSDVKQILQTTAEDLGRPGFDRFYGYGRVNAKRAVAEALLRP